MKLKDMDIVYVVKDAVYNEELKYSLRSIEKNFPYNRLWFYGGKPMRFSPDKQVIVNQKGPTKWDNVRDMLKVIAENEEITEDFVFFNDDFFVMKPVKSLPAYKYQTMDSLCDWIDEQNGGRPAQYALNIREVARELEKEGLPTYNFILHLPIVFNRKKLLQALERFPDTKSPRSVYGNMFLTKKAKIHEDVKIFRVKELPPEDADYISTDDNTFRNGLVGAYIRSKFPDKSRFER